MSITQEGNLESKFEKKPIGFMRSLDQVGATTRFELRRNVKNGIIALFVAGFTFLLSLIINIITERRLEEIPETATEYITSYLGMISFFILIIATMFGGNIIALDYDKQTGNLLFPKITKGRLFVGRLIARYLLSALAVIFYYILVVIAAAIKYTSLPVETWASLGWALLYTFLVLSLVIFFSSFMRKTSTTIVVSLVMILMVFTLGGTILTITGVEIEPLFILTYYSNIITQSFAMPTDRFVEGFLGAGPHPGGDAPTIMQWITPSVGGAIIGMVIYSAILLVAAYFLFRRRQQK
ncbi:MAG: ABC transporter permease subunit [Candidatus Heimdallarchaeota archaeon]|nr:ABC transporter permease subunit [Candidatus Heimdallarchaeota archaeon]MCK4876234.1 ABC transporter permease subunit [Candidatus Heimdallarchaeota archaeon]